MPCATSPSKTVRTMEHTAPPVPTGPDLNTFDMAADTAAHPGWSACTRRRPAPGSPSMPPASPTAPQGCWPGPDRDPAPGLRSFKGPLRSRHTRRYRPLRGCHRSCHCRHASRPAARELPVPSSRLERWVRPIPPFLMREAAVGTVEPDRSSDPACGSGQGCALWNQAATDLSTPYPRSRTGPRATLRRNRRSDAGSPRADRHGPRLPLVQPRARALRSATAAGAGLWMPVLASVARAIGSDHRRMRSGRPGCPRGAGRPDTDRGLRCGPGAVASRAGHPAPPQHPSPAPGRGGLAGGRHAARMGRRRRHRASTLARASPALRLTLGRCTSEWQWGQNDAAMIKVAIETDRTATGKSYHGKGLDQIKGVISNAPAGRLRVLSRRGKYVYSKQDMKESVQTGSLREDIGGTLIHWELNLGTEL